MIILIRIETGLWEMTSTFGAVPSPRYAHASAVVGSNLYIFGGYDGNNLLNDLFVLDFGT
jgi:hypothetical protein